MDIDELKKKLDKLQVPKRAYSLLSKQNDRLCIELREGVWVVYFFERGEENFPKQFINEADACEFMLHELRYDTP